MRPDLERGIELFNRGAYYACHECLEEAWMFEVAPRRRFLQAIIHYAVACYHQERGNAIGAIRQLQRGLDKLAEYQPEFECVDTGRLYEDGSTLLSLIQEGSATVDFPSIRITESAAS